MWLLPGINIDKSKQNNSYVQMKSVWLKKQQLEVSAYYSILLNIAD